MSYSTSDPNFQTPARNVRAVLTRYGVQNEYRVRSLSGTRANVENVPGQSLPGSHLAKAKRLLESSGLLVEDCCEYLEVLA